MPVVLVITHNLAKGSDLMFRAIVWIIYLLKKNLLDYFVFSEIKGDVSPSFSELVTYFYL